MKNFILIAFMLLIACESKPVHQAAKEQVKVYRAQQSDDSWLYYYIICNSNNDYYYTTSRTPISNNYNAVIWSRSTQSPVQNNNQIEKIEEVKGLEQEVDVTNNPNGSPEIEVDHSAPVASEPITEVGQATTPSTPTPVTEVDHALPSPAPEVDHEAPSPAPETATESPSGDASGDAGGGGGGGD
jgi:hypothetical protein